MDKIHVKRYSAAFKQSVVREYEAGASMTALLKRYGIGISRMLLRWIKGVGSGEGGVLFLACRVTEYFRLWSAS